MKRWELMIVVFAAAVSGCGGAAVQKTSTPAPMAIVAATPLPAAQADQWLSFDATAKTVSLTMVAGADGVNAGYNFNGYANGSLVISVPRGWKVTVQCKTAPFERAHSCSVVREAGTLTPAFPGSTVPDPNGAGFVNGGDSKTFSFTPDRALVGRFACLLTGHQAAGMWSTFQVMDSGQPSLGTKA